MENTAYKAIAIVGAGAVLPDAPNVPAFWENIKGGRSSISEVSPDRWDPAFYYDPDPSAPDKTYSKIGGWVREYSWDPIKWRLPIPPRVAAAMDGAQQWALACTREALEGYGYPKRPLNADRTAVILGNAMGGEKHYLTCLRAYFPEYAHELAESATFSALSEAVRRDITRELHQRIAKRFPEITEDSMPGELSNCIAGRIANLYNFHGPNYITDAACASAMAAITSAVEGLIQNDYDVAITGGIDRNMGPSTFIKFCKIGALSATGSRPFADGADGFVMGEGAVVFIFKRLADAERDGDKIYAVLRGIGASSDGKGKGITAPNPVGQKFCLERAWQNAGLSPASATYIEAHGTSTRVGDAVEAESLDQLFGSFHLPPGTVALGSVKSNIGHLKASAASAGLLKATLALRDKVLPPSINCEHPSPNIDFAHSPLYVNTKLQPWTVPADKPRCVGVSAFGFGGTNFHTVLEEYVPGRLSGNGKRSVAVSGITPVAPKGGSAEAKDARPTAVNDSSGKPPLRGALVIGAASNAELTERLRTIQKAAEAGTAPAPAAPSEADLRAPERLAIDYADAADLADKSAKALKALAVNQPAMWKALRAQGIFRGHGPAPKVAFLYTGQGSQYVNMMQVLRDREPVVAQTFAEADRVMTPLLGKPLSDIIFVNGADAEAVARAEDDLRQTAITQPAVISGDIAMTRLLAEYGIRPDMTMGHSVGEYGALVAAGGLSFDDAMEAVSARGREMTRVALADNGKMAAVFAPLAEIERILKTIDGYVVVANINSYSQAVIGGSSEAVDQAILAFQQAGYEAAQLPVSHAFHTSIVAPASEPLRQMLQRLSLQSPRLPIVKNVDGEFYPTGPDVVPEMLDILARQVASPVQFVKGLLTLYEAGARVFVEVGPKKALHGFAEDVLGNREGVLPLFTNHPKFGEIVSFNQALCGMYSAGLGCGRAEASLAASVSSAPSVTTSQPAETPQPLPVAASPMSTSDLPPARMSEGRYAELGRLFAEFLERGWKITHGNGRTTTDQPVAITGAALGLPGTERIFDDTNIARILRGDQFINVVPMRFRQAMLEKHITRLVKSENGGPTFETINDVADVIKLAARGGAFDLEKEYGLSSERVAALDRVTALAIAAGIDALRDAGIPLVMRYKTTSKGTQLPDRWSLPDALRDDTGVIFASAFPGCDSFADIMSGHYVDQARHEQLAMLERLRARPAVNGDSVLRKEIDQRISELRTTLEKEPYAFDRRFLFRVLPMGHSQFAELIGARGPNTQINSACASTTTAVTLAEDWIRAGRCRRVVIVSADDVTSDHLLEWMGAGFLASGAAATDEAVEEAAIPFDRRRHGMIIGMGAAALVVESDEAVRERGLQPICEVLSSVTANSAFHGTRLDVQHIGQVMEDVITQAERRHGISRQQIAPHTVFVSHETYTPARGGSASAEIYALRKVFGSAADQIVIANTKGFTGHAMATGVEDVVAIKALETGCVPPVANFKEVDPELGALNLSKGGTYPIEYALHLGAGFGSQISMELLRWVKTKDGARRSPADLGYAYRIVDAAAWKAWLNRITGYSAADLEVVNRTLRVRDQGALSRIAEGAHQVRPAAPVVAPVPSAPPAPVIAAKPATTTPEAPPAAAMAAKAAAAAPAVRAPKPAPGTAAVVAPASTARPEPDEGPAVARASTPSPKSARQEPAATAELKPSITKPSAVPSAPTKPVSTDDTVKQRILALVSEKTGYPIEMLDVDLDLEADLGVDTVKQAEVMATIREAYGIPRDDTIKLRDFPTLAHVIRFVHDRRPDLAQATAPTKAAAAEPTKEEAKPVAPVVPAEQETKPAPVAAAATPSEKVVPPAPVPAVPQARKDVKERILALVVEKTGYPQEMLDLDLDLEADLGVDTVKQAEMFAAIRELYSIPRDENLKLRDFPTLAHVIQFVYDRRPDLAIPAERPAQPEVAPVTTVETQTASETAAAITEGQTRPASVAAAVSERTPAGVDVKERILQLVVEKTGYPKEMLDLDLDLEADLGVDTVKQAEMFAAIRELYSIPRDENLKLRDFPTLAHVIRFVYDRRPDLATPSEQPAKPEPAPVTTVEPQTASETAAVATDEQTKLAPVTAAVSEPARAGVDVKERILQLVVEKTGYPKEMLDLDLDLEADLGVDTVKQAEMFAAVREIYNIPRDENRKLRDFPTLAHVIRFVYDNRRDLAEAGPPPAASAAATAAAGSDVAPPATTPAPPSPVAVEAAAPQRLSTGAADADASATHVEPAAPEPVPAAAKSGPEPVPTFSAEDVKNKVLEIVAEKTGYPQEMLDLDLDLEADLGIDTVKQAEMFAAVRSAYNIPRDETLKLRDFPTLAHVIKFAQDRLPKPKAAVAASAPASVQPQPAPDSAAAPVAGAPAPVAAVRPMPASFDAANRIPRRVPVPNLRPPLDLCKPTGVALGQGRRVIIMPDQGGVADALAQRLQTVGVEVLRLDRTLPADGLTNQLAQWLAAGSVHGVYWLPALDDEGPHSNMDLAAWHEAIRLRLKSLYTTMRAVYEQIAAPGTFLVTATRLGGKHGYDERGATAPLGGAVTGFTKTYKRERPDCLVKAVDFELQRNPAEVAGILVEETLHDPGAVEIGYTGEQRWTISLQEQPAADGQPGLKLDKNAIFLITGAAGSIVSAITADLAAASGGTFYLLDLVPEPDANNPDLKRFVNDREGLKRDLFARIQARGERATPALVERELAALERAQAAQSAIDAVRAAGGTPFYFSVNLTDAEAVAKVIDQVRARNGRIDVLLHAAGMERSHFLPAKEPREFDLVFDVKSDGWFNLLRAIGNMPLAATVAFSSIAGRFGNAGQTDYSSANDLLCKITSSFRTTRPATRGIVIDWTAWGGIGMATRGSIPKMMELAGIDMLPPEAGVPTIRRELTVGGTRGEVVVGHRLGALLTEFDPAGGLDTGRIETSDQRVHGPMIGKVASAGLHSGLVIETTLDPHVQAFLYDHQIDGTPVLPGVMGIEAFAEAAAWMVPGWHVAAVEEVNFLAPFKFYRSEPRTLTIQSVISPQRDTLLAECRLIGRRLLPNQAEPQVTTHFTAHVRLTKAALAATTMAVPGAPAGPAIKASDIYRIYFHGPAYRVIEHAWWDGNRIIGEMAKNLPVHHQPPERPVLMSPRLIELCFQTAGLWEIGMQGRMGLPLRVEQVSVFRSPDAAKDRLYAAVTPSADQASFDAEVVDAAGNRYVHLRGYRTVALPNAIDSELLKPLHAPRSLQAAA